MQRGINIWHVRHMHTVNSITNSPSCPLGSPHHGSASVHQCRLHRIPSSHALTHSSWQCSRGCEDPHSTGQLRLWLAAHDRQAPGNASEKWEQSATSLRHSHIDTHRSHGRIGQPAMQHLSRMADTAVRSGQRVQQDGCARHAMLKLRVATCKGAMRRAGTRKLARLSRGAGWYGNTGPVADVRAGVACGRHADPRHCKYKVHEPTHPRHARPTLHTPKTPQWLAVHPLPAGRSKQGKGFPAVMAQPRNGATAVPFSSEVLLASAPCEGGECTAQHSLPACTADSLTHDCTQRHHA